MSDADLGIEDFPETGSEPSTSDQNNVKPIRDDIEIPTGVDPHQAEAHFQSLGHNQGAYFFITRRGKQLIKLRASNLGHVPSLLQLAPLQWWEREFPSESGFKGKSLNQAANWLIAKSYQAGVFSIDLLRGRGAWMDDGRIVVHLGDKLMVDGEFFDVGFLESRYVYEALPALPSNMDDELSDHDAQKLLKLMKLLNWERPIYATLAAGWVVSAICSGCLRWRPHIMITGPSGCGKSWTVELIQQILGDYVLAAKGESTEAGLRQAIQHDALPVTWDEAEGEDQRTAANLDRVLGLMRQASADVGGKILKGGDGGQGASYTIATSFLLSAIRVPLKQSADESRITVLSLQRNGNPERVRFAEEILPLAEEIQSREWGNQFRARVLRHAGIVRKNALTFATAAGAALQNTRLGDQLGPMLAGASLLVNTKEVAPETARRWVESIDITDQAMLTEERDEDKLLSALLEASVRVPLERSTTHATVGKLLSICMDPDIDDGIIDRAAAMNALSENGIKIKDGLVCVSNTHRAVARLLRDTAWGVGWARILSRLDGSQKVDRIRFAGANSRAVGIPIGYFSPQE